MKRFLIILPVLFFLGCSAFDSEQSLSDSLVVATAIEPTFYILNKAESTIIYFVLETETSYVVDYGDLCQGSFPSLNSGEQISIPYKDIEGWNQEAESVFFTWTDCKQLSESENINL